MTFEPRRCYKCQGVETPERPLHFVSLAPGVGGVYCQPCANGDHGELVTK